MYNKLILQCQLKSLSILNSYLVVSICRDKPLSFKQNTAELEFDDNIRVLCLEYSRHCPIKENLVIRNMV